MTTTTPELTSDLAGAAYPDLLRMGHKFVTSIGQRLIVDGFYGAMDFAFGGDGWLYVLNRRDFIPFDALRPMVRIAVCNVDENQLTVGTVVATDVTFPAEGPTALSYTISNAP